MVAGLVTIGGASAAAGAGTMAAFSDTDSSTDNAINAGTLDLTLDGASETVTFLEASEITPGDTGTDSVTVANEGSANGLLQVTIEAIQSLDKQGNPGGNLDEFLEIQATIAGQVAFTSPTTVDQLSEDDELFSGIVVDDIDRTFELAWELRDVNGVNQAKGHSVQLDFSFKLISDGGG